MSEEIKDITVETLSDDELSSVAGGADNISHNWTACCTSVNQSSCCPPVVVT